MNADTPCYIVRFNELVRAACLEALGQESYGSVTVTRGCTTYQVPSWQATIGFAREIRTLGSQQGKPIVFQIVVSRRNGSSNRFVLDTEWYPSARNKKSLKRTIQTALKKIPGKSLVKGRAGLM